MSKQPHRSSIATVACDYLQIGDTCYLVRYDDLNRGTTQYSVSAEPGRTNMSHEPLERGWLGTTNNVSATAEGLVVLTGWVGSEGKVRFRRLREGSTVHTIALERISTGERAASLVTRQESEAAARAYAEAAIAGDADLRVV